MKGLYILLVILPYCWAQYESASERRFVADPELSNIPTDIVNCYTNSDLWDRLVFAFI